MFLLEYVMHVVVGILLIGGVFACIGTLTVALHSVCKVIGMIRDILLHHWFVTFVASSVIYFGVTSI